MSGTESAGELKLDLTPGQERALQVLAGGGTLKDVRGLSQDDVETVYAIGFNLYNQAKYAQSEPMFQFACLYAHTEPRYWMALANCRQMQKKSQPGGSVAADPGRHLLPGAAGQAIRRQGVGHCGQDDRQRQVQ